jgi:hypothetical protein
VLTDNKDKNSPFEVGLTSEIKEESDMRIDNNSGNYPPSPPQKKVNTQ